MIRTILLYLLFSIATIAVAQEEICNNGIDDDGDELIDLNDDDCDCPSRIPSGLIPNPSFEDRSCCPQSHMELHCADAWQQASAATSDYYHTCGLTSPWWVGKTAPQPLPDGEGYVGFRDGRATNGQFKEYVGACLTETMEVGIEYRLDFFLGFAPELLQSIDMTIYGTTECSNVPFGIGNDNFGCPTNGPGWTLLDHRVISGQGEWSNVIFDIIADKPYTAIVLGPGCEVQDDLQNEWYFFVDRLALSRLTDFDVPFANIEGNLCEEDLTIVAQEDEEYGYQWYKDGIAIIGETDIKLDLDVDPANEGLYSVLITTPEGCFNSEDFNLTIPVFETEVNESICPGDTVFVGSTPFFFPGSWEIPLTSSQGCDSLVNLTIEQLESYTTPLNETICQGESFTFGNQTLTSTGNYMLEFTAQNGCDSLVELALTVQEEYANSLSIDLCQGESFSFDGQELTNAGVFPFNYTSSAGCDSTITVIVELAQTYTEQASATICEGESYMFGDQLLTQTNTYMNTLTSSMGCDSSVTLDLTVAQLSNSAIDATICLGESYQVGDIMYTEAGEHTTVLANSQGCDSTVVLDLEVINWENGVVVPSDTTVELGASLSIMPFFIDPAFGQYAWTNSSGEIISQSSDLFIEQVLGADVFTIQAIDAFGCTDQDDIRVRVDRNIGIYAANIFSPNRDGINDHFRPVVNGSISSIRQFSIYDRWGNLVFTQENVSDLENWQGWDGTFNGKPAVTGVYVYHCEAMALDGVVESISGDVTLVR